MTRVRQVCATILLSLVLAYAPAIAGEMPGPGITPPPPPPEYSVTGDMPGGVTSPGASTETSATGNMPTGVTASIDPLTEFTLSLLQSVFSLF